MKTIKRVTYILSFIFTVCGILLITLGIMYTISINQYIQAIPKLCKGVLEVPVLTILTGLLILVLSFLGACGSKYENLPYLYTYTTLLIIISLLHIIVLVMVLKYFTCITEIRIRNKLYDIFDSYSTTRDDVNSIQRNLRCCGPDGPLYWKSIAYKYDIPGSCCKQPDDQFCKSTDPPTFQETCSESVYSNVTSYMNVIMFFIIFVIVTKFGAIICAFALIKLIKTPTINGGDSISVEKT